MPSLEASSLARPSRWRRTSGRSSATPPKMDALVTLGQKQEKVRVRDSTLTHMLGASSHGKFRSESTSGGSDWQVAREPVCPQEEDGCIHRAPRVPELAKSVTAPGAGRELAIQLWLPQELAGSRIF